MRSPSVDLFHRRILLAAKAYRAAGVGYSGGREEGLSARCFAWNCYAKFYLATKASVKKELLDSSWRLAKQALDFFTSSGDFLGFAETFDQLSVVLPLGLDFHWNARARGYRLRDGITFGRQAIRSLSPVHHRELLARILVRLALFIDVQGDEGFQFEKQEDLDREAAEYWRKAEELDKDKAMLQAAYPPSGFFRVLPQADCDRIREESLKQAQKVGDNFAIGWQLDHLSGLTFFKAFSHPDPRENTRVSKESLRLAEKAAAKHALVNFVTSNQGVIWSMSPYAEHLLQLSWFETDPAKRRLLCEKSWHETRNLLRLARLSGYPRVMAYAHHVTSKILLEFSEYAQNKFRRRGLVRESLNHRKQSIWIIERIMPNSLHHMATYLRYLAEIEESLAGLEEGRSKKVRLLKEAVKIKERGLVMNAKFAEMVSGGQPHIVKRLVGKNYLEYGDLLTRLYGITNDEKILSKVAKAYSDAATLLKDTTSYRGLGEAYWKAGEAYDQLRANLAAAENFVLAAKTYGTMYEKNPQMGTLFQDYARYLEAWSNIEYARASHRRLAFDESEKFYEKAAELHKSAGRWSFLAPYYNGLARLESAENLSRRGQSSESILAFRDAAQLFRESSISLQKHATVLERPEEKTMLERIATSFKEQYCLVRVVIEEARTAEDQGDYRTSAYNFRKASELLHEISRKIVSGRERNELLHISSLSMAWHYMAQATVRDPVQAFRDAAVRFEESLDYCPDEDARNLSLGHKYFCEALTASTQFTYTLDPTFYETATKYLTIASSHFANAGFSVQSTHVQACKMLLDAHALIARSSKEPGAAERARDYQVARTLLRQAAEGFKQAHQRAKQQQVLSLTESVDERYGLASRLAEISKAVSYFSPTVAFPAPARGEEAPVGHSIFAGAGIDARYGPSTSLDSQRGGEVLIEVSVANIGSQPIRITRLVNILPDGAQANEVPLNAKVDGRSIILDQRRTDPMSTETFKVIVDPEKRPAIIKPVILYADENGREHSQELPARILVGSPVLEYLAREFMEDFRSKRLGMDHCGWRTLMRVVESLKIPRSHVYGEPRWGHRHGRQLEALISSKLVESRVFPGERGRGGSIVKVRLAYDQDLAKQYAEQITASKEQTREA
jgi:tetratricopeptide (TPR) repeat protein